MANWGKILSRGNVEDRRSAAPIVGGVGVGGIVLYILVSLLTNGQVSIPLDQLQTLPSAQQAPNSSQFEGQDNYEVFASTVLGSNNDLWGKEFSTLNKTYTPPTLVLFRQATSSACGVATSQVGPHYCNIDKTIYLDETFFDELTNRFGAQGGDVAQAYVIAHEVGHHAQNELGILDQVNEKANAYPSLSQNLSINLELQADCFAGLWANSIKDQGVLSPGEINEALDAAAAVGDDRIQKSVTGRINPETWTHGTSEQRVSWFTKGYNAGDMGTCDTFASR